jgi:hypothetical protein
VKFSRLATLARVQKREREAEAVRAEAERIARSLVPPVSAGGERYPLEVRDDSLFGLGSTLQLNARPDNRYLMVRKLPPADWAWRDRTWANVETFRMRAVEYAMQKDQLRLVWYGWAPSEDFPSAEVKTCLHAAMPALVGLDDAVGKIQILFRNDNRFMNVAAMVGHYAATVREEVESALGLSTQRWEHGLRVGATGGP